MGWVSLAEVGTGAGALLAVGALLAGVWRVLRSGAKWLLAELDERLDTKIDPLHDELRTNGGSSLRDAVNRIEDQGDRAERQLLGVTQGLYALEVRLEAVESKQGEVRTHLDEDREK